MKIRMLKTVPGSLDGIRVTTYEDGVEYDLTKTAGARELAAAFVDAQMAVELESPSSPVEDLATGLPASAPDGVADDEQPALPDDEQAAAAPAGTVHDAGATGKRKGRK